METTMIQSVHNKKPAILITGVSGMIGSTVCRQFDRDYRLIGLDVEPPREACGDVDFHQVDLTDAESVESVLETIRKQTGGHLASVLHLAAYYDFSGQDSPLYQKITIAGTKRLLRALQKFELVEQFIFSSTLLVMKPAERPLAEDDPTRAEWPYPVSKLLTERVIHDKRGSIPAVILRIAGVYDEHCHSWPLSHQISRIYEKQFESYLYPGQTNHGTAFVHLLDLVDVFRRSIERRGELGEEEIFLIAEPGVMSYSELQDQLGKLIHHKRWPTIRIPKPVAKAGAWVKGKLADDDDSEPIKPWMVDLADDHYEARITKARTKLGWVPKHRLRTTLPSMIEHLRENPVHFYEEHELSIPEEMPEIAG
jgi:nucleoside-diphosphate-sugar epimerase